MAQAQEAILLILIVDDSLFERTVMRAILEEAGYTVREAQSGLEALEAAREKPPQLLITDVLMPQMDGFDLTRRLRAQNHATPVAMVTGLEDPLVILQGLDAGADGFLPKPYSHEQLKGLVASFLTPPVRTVHADPQHLYAVLRATLERQADLHRRLAHSEKRHQRSLGMLGALDQELRTPLEGLRSWLEGRSATDALAELGLRRADRLLSRLDDVREMLRLESGEVALEQVPIPVGDALLQAVEAARLQGQTVGSTPPADGLAAKADPGRFLQALVGLLVYAGQHSENSPVSVRAYPSGPAVAFEVRSRGEDEPVEDAPLAMVRQLIELQGGTFSYDTQAEKGTTFRFTLPQHF